MSDYADEIFEAFENNAEEEFYHSFRTDEDLNNIEAMRVFLEEWDLTENVSEDDGTMVFLTHEEYDFEIVVESYGEGDFYSHGTVIYRN